MKDIPKGRKKAEEDGGRGVSTTYEEERRHN